MDQLKEQAEKTYRAIGRFIFEFSQTEYTIRKGLEIVLGLDQKFFDPVIQSYDVALLCKVTKHAVRSSRSSETAEQIDKLINRFFAMNETRQRVAHGLWVPHFSGGKVSHVSRQKLAAVMHSDQTEALEKKSTELGETRDKLWFAFNALEEPSG